MIIFPDGTWQTHSDFPDTDFTNGEGKYIISDESELAAKIMSMPYINPILDESGNIIDAEPLTTNQEIENDIKSQLSQIDLEAIRPLRAILSGEYTEEDTNKLLELENKAKALRIQLKGE